MNASIPRSDGAGVALGVGAALAFSTLAIFAKLGYREGADALPLLATRFSIAAALLWIVALIRRPVATGNRTSHLRLLLLGAFGYGLESFLFFSALERAPAAIVGLVFYSYPLWTSLFSITARLEPFTWRLVAALVLGTAGVALVFATPLSGLAGPLFALGAAVAVAVYFTLAQVAVRDTDVASAARWTATGAAVALVTISLIARKGLPIAAFPAAGALGIATVIAFLLMYASITRIGSARSSIATMLEPVATVVLAAIILNEDITLTIVMGTLLVVAALPVLALRRRPR
ncbi:MAG: DMT family transporter [Actinomycetota bacterium]|nr:DMT family transporter [Actinomycetota bacterium]